MADQDKGITAEQLEAIIQKAVFQAMEQNAGGGTTAKGPSPLEQHLAKVLADGDRVYADMRADLLQAVQDEVKRLEIQLAHASRTAYDAIPGKIVQEMDESGFGKRLDALKKDQIAQLDRLQEVEKKAGKGRKGKDLVTVEDLSRLSYRIKELEGMLQKLNNRGGAAVATTASQGTDDMPPTEAPPATYEKPSSRERSSEQPDRLTPRHSVLWTWALVAVLVLLAFTANQVGKMITAPSTTDVPKVTESAREPDKRPDRTPASAACPKPTTPPALDHDPAWLAHFEAITAPDVVRAAFAIDELTFKDEVIRLAEFLESQRPKLVEASAGENYITLAYTTPFRFGTGGDLQVRKAYGSSDGSRNFYDWFQKAFKGETPEKPAAQNVVNLWLYLVSESTKSQQSHNSPSRAKDAFLAKLKERLQLNQGKTLATLLVGKKVDPLNEGTIEVLQSFFKRIDPAKYRQQIQALADALWNRRQDDQDYIALGDVIEEQDSKLYAVLCRNGQPTPLEAWCRAGKDKGSPAKPDKSILVLWLSAKLGIWECDGNPEAVSAMLGNLTDNAADPFKPLSIAWSKD